MKKLIINQTEEEIVKMIDNLEMLKTNGSWTKELYEVWEDQLYDIDYESPEYDFYISEKDGDRYIYRKKK